MALSSASEIKAHLPERLAKRIDDAIEDAQQQVDTLRNNNWRRPLTLDEAGQQRREINSINKISSLLKLKQENLITLGRELAPRLPRIRAALAVFEKEKVKLDSRFPSSMTYIQNPAYQGIHSAFLKIKDQAGINDDEILLAMDKIEEIGLVNISLLYERWCLLQIIKVLLFKYQYRPEEGWKRKLITQVFAKKRNISLDFEHLRLGRKISLHYELELKNGKRPDFILDVDATDRNGRTTLKKRFVMDAKFYEDINSKRHGGLEQVINELYNQKDYSEGGQNPVFIIHPSPAAAPSRATPQEWSRDNYYGEVKLFDWETSPPDHQYGGIYLSPIESGTFLDSLQRTIGMFLQYKIEDNAEILSTKNKNEIEEFWQDGIEDNDTSVEKLGALPDAKLFCMVCGSADMSVRQSPKNVNAWWVTCNDCSHFTIYNYCHACHNRLIKNGEYWSYHAMEPLQPINIKCPSCESFF